MGSKKWGWRGGLVASSLVILILFGGFVSGEVVINEVMYDPGQCSDSEGEWIELYNLGVEDVGLDGCWLDGKELEGDILGGDFFLVVRDLEGFVSCSGEEMEEIIGEWFSEGKLLERKISLKNTGEEILLAGDNCSDSYDYSVDVGWADGNNKTLERREDGSWGEGLVNGGTPGEENSIFKFSIDYEPLVISEVFPDPFWEDDALKPQGEWVELYNAGEKPISLGGLMFRDKDDEHRMFITGNKILDENGLVLLPDDHVVVYRDGDSDFALNNKDYEEVRLFFEEELIDEMNYGEAVEGMSWSNIEGDWYLTKPTPGEINELEEECDWLLVLDMNNSIYQSEGFSFDLVVSRFFGSSNNVTVRGKIEDINGEIVKEYKPWTNELIVSERVKSYSPNLKEGLYQVSFWIEEMVCNEDDPMDNQVTRLIAINPEYGEFDSFLEIEKLYVGSDEVVEWGDQFTAKVKIYKGNETKHAVELWVEKDGEVVSKRSKINIYDKFKEYVVTMPIQLKPNCHEKISEGEAKLVLEGLGLRVEEGFSIEGVDNDVCKDYLDYVKDLEKKEAKEKTKAKAYQIVDLPTLAFEGDVLRVKVQLVGDKKEHDFGVWSYLYKGNKCYSCLEGLGEREDNLVEFKLGENEVKQVDLLVRIDEDLSEGEYKLKVKLNKDGQKTNKELTEELYVKKKSLVSSEMNGSLEMYVDSIVEDGENGFEKSEKKEGILSGITGVVVYESSSEKAERMIPILLVAVLGLLCLILIWKKV